MSLRLPSGTMLHSAVFCQSARRLVSAFVVLAALPFAGCADDATEWTLTVSATTTQLQAGSALGTSLLISLLDQDRTPPAAGTSIRVLCLNTIDSATYGTVEGSPESVANVLTDDLGFTQADFLCGATEATVLCRVSWEDVVVNAPILTCALP
jgi:hypothetical protein